MFARQKKQRHDVSPVIALIVATLSLALGYAMGGAGRTTVPQRTESYVRPSQEAVDGYVEAGRWKQWRDDGYGRDGRTYFGYVVSFPRDFDVYRGDEVSGGWIDAPRVRIAFPQDAFRETRNTFGEGSLLVSVAEGMSEDECHADPHTAATDRERLPATVDIGGAAFRTITLRDGVAGNRYDTELYRTYRQGRCVELAFILRTGNPGNYPEGVERFDETRAWDVFHKIRDTFRFLDAPPPVVPAVIGGDGAQHDQRQ